MSKHPPFEFLVVEGLDFAEVRVLATAGAAVPSACDLAPLDLLLIQVRHDSHTHVINYNNYVKYTNITSDEEPAQKEF